jgi:hypothetical protein
VISPSWEARTVKPPKTRDHKWLPIVAVSLSDHVSIVERTGEVIPLDDLPNRVMGEPSSLWVCAGAAELVGQLNVVFDNDPAWQYRVSPVKRDVFSVRRAATGRKRQTTGTVVAYFGFRRSGSHTRTKQHGHWHYPLDPAVFLPDVMNSHHVHDLLAWAQDVRAFCQEHGLAVKPTAGGIAGQLLRHPLFYPEARRKVPRATNARARAVLPGNHYELRASTSGVTAGWYLDMRSAHHNCAADLTFPISNGLLARGHYHVTTEPTDTTIPDTPSWAPRGTVKYDHILKQAHGLLLLRLSSPLLPPSRWPLPYLRAGTFRAWVFTNELPTLHEFGVSVDAVDAAWISFGTDRGLNRYAQWSLVQLATATRERLDWLKPTLLATYGILAARPRVTEYAYKRADRGVQRWYPAGKHPLSARAYISEKEQEVPTCNVIQRGMIEAETRKRSLDLARWLTTLGHNVLCVYADAVIVEQGPPLPLLPAPWGIKTPLTRLRFLHPNAFVSQEMKRLPGLPKESAARVRLVHEIMQPKGTLPDPVPTEWLALSEAEKAARLGQLE